MANVRFLSVKLKSSFDALATKDNLALYWIEETQELYKGSLLFGTGSIATDKAAGLLSPEDYVSLKELIAGGTGIKGLTPVDGTIVISNDGTIPTIKVGLSAVDGNMLTVKEDGLYAKMPIIPEYAIEKQSEAEDGFASTYKLKKTVGDVISYVGDAINIAKDMVLKSAVLEIVTENGVPYLEAKIGDHYIKMEFNDENTSALYVPVNDLVDVYTAGSGIEIIDNKISVKIADSSNGLVAVDGALSINLATRKSNGAMSKEDKLFIDSIPSVYSARKYDISETPIGTLVDYRDHEIRIMCPNDAEFKKQTVGAGGDANTYYMTVKTYVPNDSVVGYIEHLGNQVDDEILTKFSVDEYGRRYQSTWLGLAKFDDKTGVWTYYGANSTENKFIGWDYQIDWYDVNNKIISSDSVRINLSNESCHYINKPYYMANYATSKQIAELEDSIGEMSESFIWADM